MTAPREAIYAASAYRSDTPEPLPPPKWAQDANRTGLFDTRLAFGHYAHLEPEMEVTTQLECEEHKAYQRQQEKGKKQEVYCDVHRWRFQNSSKIPQILFTLKLMLMPFVSAVWGIGIALSFLPDTGREDVDIFFALLGCGAIVTIMITSLALFMSGKKLVHKIQISGFFICVAIVLWKQGSLWGSEDMHIALWLGTFLYFMATIGLDCLIWLHSNISVYDGSEFNRRDGMLRFKRRFRRLFVAPFEEFDPVLQLLPNGFGAHDYALWLHHRYTDNKICLATKIHSLGLNQAMPWPSGIACNATWTSANPCPTCPCLNKAVTSTRSPPPTTLKQAATPGAGAIRQQGAGNPRAANS